jgi:hypothetical protein
MVAANTSDENAMTETAPGPCPVTLTGLAAGIVSAGGGSTGGRGPAAGSGAEADGGDGDRGGDGEAFVCGAMTVVGRGCDRGCAVGFLAGVAVGSGRAPVVGVAAGGR